LGHTPDLSPISQSPVGAMTGHSFSTILAEKQQTILPDHRHRPSCPNSERDKSIGYRKQQTNRAAMSSTCQPIKEQREVNGEQSNYL
jgi:hypothetical protein